MHYRYIFISRIKRIYSFFLTFLIYNQYIAAINIDFKSFKSECLIKLLLPILLFSYDYLHRFCITYMGGKLFKY
jgi:hypothetical protein